jgi:uncharacterized protein (TIGR00369 family)
MDGIEFLTAMRDERVNYPPIGAFVDFEIDEIAPRHLTGTGVPRAEHYNPLGVVHGGFAGTLLDLALGHVSITVLENMAYAVSTTDLSVKYMRSISKDTGKMRWTAEVLHAGKTVVIAQASLYDNRDRLCAMAQSTCIITRRRD